MSDIIAGNVIGIVLLAILGAFFAPDLMPRWFAALWVANIAFWISIVCWVIYIAHHFLVKAW